MSDDEILEPRMKEKEDEFKEEEEALKVDKSQENQQQQPTESNIDIPTLQSGKRSHEEEGSSNIAPQKNTAIKRIKLTAESTPNWLIEVLDWIKRTEMADSSLSTSHWIFEQLCWPKLHGRKVKAHRVKRLMSLRDSESPNPRSKLMLCVSNDGVLPRNYTTIPIANIHNLPMPKYITGFSGIDLRFLDGPILEFMENMLPYFDPIGLYFKCNIQNKNDIRIGPIRRLLTILAPKIHELLLPAPLAINLCDFKRLFPGIIEEIQHITNVNAKRSECDLLLKWLNTERADGKPKALAITMRTDEETDNFVDRVKQEFLRSKRKAAFIIIVGWAYLPNETLENEATGEVLSICQGEHWYDDEYSGGMVQYLVRHPKGMEWTNFVKELFWHREGWTSVHVEIEDPPQRKWKCPCSIL